MMMKPSFSEWRAFIFTVLVAAASAPFVLWAGDFECQAIRRVYNCGRLSLALTIFGAFVLHGFVQKHIHTWLHKYDGYKYVGRSYKFEGGVILLVFAVSCFIPYHFAPSG